MKNSSLDNQKENIFVLLAAYWIYFSILLILYVDYVHEYWEYTGFLLDIKYEKVGLSFFLVSLFVLIIPAGHSVRGYFLNLALTVAFIPSLVLFSLAGKAAEDAYVIWFAFAVVYGVSAIPIARFAFMRIDVKPLMWFLALACVCLIASFLAFGGLRNFNLDLSRVYEFREQSANNLPAIFGYLSPIFSKAIISFGVVAAFFYRKYIYVIFFLVVAFLIYGFTSHKGVLLYPVIAVFLYYLLSYFKNYSVILLMLIAALSLSFIDVIGLRGAEPGTIWGWYSTLLVRRALMVPALLDYYHIEFFSENPTFHWATSRLSFGMVESPYDLPAPNVIGEAFLGSAETAANTGFIGSGFAQAGLLGVSVYSIGVGAVVSLVNSYGKYLGRPFVAAVMTAQIMTMLVSTDFVTLFITHGMIVSLLLLAMINPPQSASRKKASPSLLHPPVAVAATP